MDRGHMTVTGRGLRYAAALTLILAQSLIAAVESRLMDQNGRPLDARALSGHWLLVYFGYASCKEICPAALSTLGAVLNRLGPAADRIEPTFLYLVAPDGQVVQMLHPQQPVDDLVATIRSHFVNWAQ